jgi:predicted phosphodiesterase
MQRALDEVHPGEGVLFGRPGWTGQQAVGVTWGGDQPSDFWSLRTLVAATLTAAASGFSNWSHDVGGYLGERLVSRCPKELLLRWVQFGCFTPLMHAHGRFEQEAWTYDAPTLAVYREYVLLHERLLPYVRAAAATAARCGLPVIRPLLLTHPGDPRGWAMADAYGYGPSLWVAPVLEAGAREREVELPAGDWIDFWSGDEVAGGGARRRVGGRAAAGGDAVGRAAVRPRARAARRRHRAALDARRVVGARGAGGGVRGAVEIRAVRLGVVSDVHWTTEPDTRAEWHGPFDFAALPGRLDRARTAFRRARVDAVIAGGDVAHFGDAASARAALERLSAGLERPLLVVAGNRDCEQRDDMLAATVAGAMLTATEIAGVRIAGVAIERDGGSFRWTGALDAAALVVTHFPVLSRAERLAGRGLKYAGDLTNRAALQARVTGADPVVVLSGHIHARETSTVGNVLQLSAGALIEAPYEIAIVDLDAASVRRRIYLLGPRVTPRDPVFTPADETWAFADGGWRPVL